MGQDASQIQVRALLIQETFQLAPHLTKVQTINAPKQQHFVD